MNGGPQTGTRLHGGHVGGRGSLYRNHSMGMGEGGEGGSEQAGLANLHSGGWKKGHKNSLQVSGRSPCRRVIVTHPCVASVCACVLCHSVVYNSVSPWIAACRRLCPWASPGKNPGVGCRALLLGIFLTQGSNLHLLWLLHRRWVLHC